jgi:predicted O-linked N-acetylglucosamine transferase (SPINDLY family)
MGVPVITLAGATHSARVSASLLQRVGLGDWATASPDDFVERALRAANDIQVLAALRQDLRGRMQSSPLCDGVGYAAAVEAAYAAMWAAQGA